MSGTADLCARRHKNIYIEREKRDDERRHALGTSVGVSFFERKIASDNVSLVFQSLTESSVAHLGPTSTNASRVRVGPMKTWMSFWPLTT